MLKSNHLCAQSANVLACTFGRWLATGRQWSLFGRRCRLQDPKIKAIQDSMLQQGEGRNLSTLASAWGFRCSGAPFAMSWYEFVYILFTGEVSLSRDRDMEKVVAALTEEIPNPKNRSNRSPSHRSKASTHGGEVRWDSWSWQAEQELGFWNSAGRIVQSLQPTLFRTDWLCMTAVEIFVKVACHSFYARLKNCGSRG
jgi:hypothetical protein